MIAERAESPLSREGLARQINALRELLAAAAQYFSQAFAISRKLTADDQVNPGPDLHAGVMAPLARRSFRLLPNLADSTLPPMQRLRSTAALLQR
jgi:hypothetical protein